jgi:beta-glucosidase
VKERVEDLLARMTLAEKLGQLSQGVYREGLPRPEPNDPMLQKIAAGEVGSFIWCPEDPALSNLCQHVAVEKSRLGIPLLLGLDVIHGYRTLFPVPLAMACSFEPSLLERMQTVAARETRASGVHWSFTPLGDVARDARWGRVAETSGEDPFLVSQCVAAQVRGFQGRDPSAPDRVASCLKHFVGYSAVQAGLDYDNTEITEGTLRNLHLPSFRSGVEAGVLTVMSGFNAIGGVPSVVNHHTLTEILRDEWKFSGLVVSDWEAVNEVISWGYAQDGAEAARLSLMAGNDMEMVSHHYRQTLGLQVVHGVMPESVIDKAVRRVLTVKFKLGLFDHPFVDEKLFPSVLLTPEAVALAKECAEKSLVLVKNDGVLPLRHDLKKIALVGPFADNADEMLGCWTARGRASDVVTLLKGLRSQLPSNMALDLVQGCAVQEGSLTRTDLDGMAVALNSSSATPMSSQIKAVVAAAQQADLVIMALGEARGWTGENTSRTALDLTGRQQALFDAVSATGKPIVTLLFCGRPLSPPRVFEKSKAVMFVWQPGIQAGPALASVLTGEKAPSGRLAISVPFEVGQLPLFYNRLRTGYHGGQRASYREVGSEARYWFGHGLTYTTFDYSPVTILPRTETQPARATITLKNTGSRAGDEVVQLYLRQLVCREAARPEQELRGFRRISLSPGESQSVSFDLTPEVLGYFSRNGEWRADPGEYDIWIAPSSHHGQPTRFTY